MSSYTKLYTVGSIIKYLNKKYPDIKIKPYTFRFWEKKFTNIKPYKIINKRKYYNYKSLIEIEKIIFLLKNKKYSISGAKNFFKKRKYGLDELNQNNVDKDNLKTNLQFKLKLLNEKLKNLKNKWQKKAR